MITTTVIYIYWTLHGLVPCCSVFGNLCHGTPVADAVAGCQEHFHNMPWLSPLRMLPRLLSGQCRPLMSHANVIIVRNFVFVFIF